VKKILVFASGSGSNFQSMIDAVERGELTAQICGLIVNKLGIGAIERAEKHHIPVFHISEKEFETYEAFVHQLVDTCISIKPDVIVLAGYMRKVPTQLIKAFEGKILNIHPALLPKFGGKGMYGHFVHEAVIAAKESESGCTVHIVTEEFDEGPILAQAVVPVYETDTPEQVQKRVLAEEHKLYPKVIQSFLKHQNP
jgi:formyltetrahydrofolate-dependent phosphoribosylglycinamide formyltransferase